MLVLLRASLGQKQDSHLPVCQQAGSACLQLTYRAFNHLQQRSCSHVDLPVLSDLLGVLYWQQWYRRWHMVLIQCNQHPWVTKDCQVISKNSSWNSLPNKAVITHCEFSAPTKGLFIYSGLKDLLLPLNCGDRYVSMLWLSYLIVLLWLHLIFKD